MKHGKKPTRAQKIRLGKAGLCPENWLVIHERRDGGLVIIHKHISQVRTLPALGTL